MANDIGSFIYEMESLGVYDYLLPFVLVFAILFAILEKTKIFGADKKNISAIVAIIVALVTVTQWEIVRKLNIFLPKISFFIIIVVMVLVLFGLMGANITEGLGGFLLFFGAIASLIAVYWALGDDIGLQLPYWLENSGPWIAAIVVLILLSLVIYGGSSTERGEKTKSMADKLNDMFGKGGSS
ncbi:hypothetical protein K8R47_01305 [archaeon]|nr:hypothetical protein [archaeon]